MYFTLNKLILVLPLMTFWEKTNDTRNLICVGAKEKEREHARTRFTT